ncbi:MAG TPA: phage baseplate assembly protein V [Chthoniobacterales bacterium]|nr:phage baseplate assembly protein V [Chthoniobacterales bacterium]
MPRTHRRAVRKNARGVRPIETPPATNVQGVYTTRVVSVRDPDGLGRVKVKLPTSIPASPLNRQVWARVATLMAGDHRGTWFVPEVGDEVVIAFEEGDATRPVVLGALWNADASPPASMDSRGENNHKLIRLRSGVQIALSDAAGEEELILETPAGQKVAIEDALGRITITDSSGNAIVLEPSGIRMTAGAKLQIYAGSVSLAAGILTIDAGTSKFSGVVQCDTLITNSVVSSSYTPGAGNIW